MQFLTDNFSQDTSPPHNNHYRANAHMKGHPDFLQNYCRTLKKRKRKKGRKRERKKGRERERKGEKGREGGTEKEKRRERERKGEKGEEYSSQKRDWIIKLLSFGSLLNTLVLPLLPPFFLSLSLPDI